MQKLFFLPLHPQISYIKIISLPIYSSQTESPSSCNSTPQMPYQTDGLCNKRVTSFLLKPLHFYTAESGFSFTWFFRRVHAYKYIYNTKNFSIATTLRLRNQALRTLAIPYVKVSPAPLILPHCTSYLSHIIYEIVHFTGRLRTENLYIFWCAMRSS